MSTPHFYQVVHSSRFLWSALCLITLTGCTLSYDHAAQINTQQQPCLAVLTKKVNCENTPSTFDNIQPHSEASQQMLPIHLRDDVLMSELEDLRNQR